MTEKQNKKNKRIFNFYFSFTPTFHSSQETGLSKFSEEVQNDFSKLLHQHGFRTRRGLFRVSGDTNVHFQSDNQTLIYSRPDLYKLLCETIPEFEEFSKPLSAFIEKGLYGYSIHDETQTYIGPEWIKPLNLLERMRLKFKPEEKPWARYHGLHNLDELKSSQLFKDRTGFYRKYNHNWEINKIEDGLYNVLLKKV